MVTSFVLGSRIPNPTYTYNSVEVTRTARMIKLCMYRHTGGCKTFVDFCLWRRFFVVLIPITRWLHLSDSSHFSNSIFLYVCVYFLFCLSLRFLAASRVCIFALLPYFECLPHLTLAFHSISSVHSYAYWQYAIVHLLTWPRCLGLNGEVVAGKRVAPHGSMW